MAEYTQEQLDAIIAEKTKGLFTEDDLHRKVTSEVDRRVESGIQKGIETQKQRWLDEEATKAKMSAEDIARKEYEDKNKALLSKEQEIKRRANSLKAQELLSEAQIPKAQYEKLISMFVSDDESVTESNVKSFIETFSQAKSEIETKVKSEFSNIPKPNSNPENKGEITKDQFAKMGYAERVVFKQRNPLLFAEYMK